MFQQSDMQRREPLDDLDIDISFHFDKIFINGTSRVNVRITFTKTFDSWHTFKMKPPSSASNNNFDFMLDDGYLGHPRKSLVDWHDQMLSEFPMSSCTHGHGPGHNAEPNR